MVAPSNISGFVVRDTYGMLYFSVSFQYIYIYYIHICYLCIICHINGCKQNLQTPGFSFKAFNKNTSSGGSLDPCVLIQVDVHSWKSTRIEGFQGHAQTNSRNWMSLGCRLVDSTHYVSMVAMGPLLEINGRFLDPSFSCWRLRTTGNGGAACIFTGPRQS